MMVRQSAREDGAAVAQKVQTLYIDDLDGSAAEGTVRFALDGTEYEIDLNAGHAQQLRMCWRPTSGLGGGSAVVPVGQLAPDARERRAG
jgi:Lsr2 protein